MAKSGPNQCLLVEASVAAVLRTTNCLQSLKEWAPCETFDREKKSRPKETTDSALRSSPEAGARSIVGFEVVAAVHVLEPSRDTNASTQMYLITEATASGLQEVKERELVAIATLLPWPAKSIIGALGCVDSRALDGCQPLDRPYAAMRR
jgi:hypothetical protein